MPRHQISIFLLCCFLAVPVFAAETLTNDSVKALTAER